MHVSTTSVSAALSRRCVTAPRSRRDRLATRPDLASVDRPSAPRCGIVDAWNPTSLGNRRHARDVAHLERSQRAASRRSLELSIRCTSANPGDDVALPAALTTHLFDTSLRRARTNRHLGQPRRRRSQGQARRRFDARRAAPRDSATKRIAGRDSIRCAGRPRQWGWTCPLVRGCVAGRIGAWNWRTSWTTYDVAS